MTNINKNKWIIKIIMITTTTTAAITISIIMNIWNQTPCYCSFSSGIICSPHLEIICSLGSFTFYGPIWGSFLVWGSVAALYRYRCSLMAKFFRPKKNFECIGHGWPWRDWKRMQAWKPGQNWVTTQRPVFCFQHCGSPINLLEISVKILPL